MDTISIIIGIIRITADGVADNAAAVRRGAIIIDAPLGVVSNDVGTDSGRSGLTVDPVTAVVADRAVADHRSRVLEKNSGCLFSQSDDIRMKVDAPAGFFT